jgi:nicotinamidase-related amidase
MRSVSAKPYDFEFDLSKTALLIIDMQRDFCAPGGFGERLGNDISPTRRIIPAIAALLETFRESGRLVIHTREGHLPDLSDCPPNKLKRSQSAGAGIGDVGPMGRILVRGEYGHDLIDELQPLPREIVIDKPGKGAFYNTDLQQILLQNDIHYLVVTGVTTHVCVHTTVREANDRGYECLVVSDGTAAYDPHDHDAALRMIYQQGGIFGWVSDHQTIVKAIRSSERGGVHA